MSGKESPLEEERTYWVGGIDEAGYGPTLGPLVITLTVFRAWRERENLWKSLAGLVARPGEKGRLHVGDSKRLFSRQQGIGRLEKGVLSFCLALPGFKREEPSFSVPSCLGDFIRRVGLEEDQDFRAFPWYRGEISLPLKAPVGELCSLAGQLKEASRRRGVRFEEAKVHLVTEERFNREVEVLGSKALLLFRESARLVKYFFERFGAGKIELDRQGGRKDYLELLKAVFPRVSLRAIERREKVSRYSLQGEREQGEIVFLRKGEERSFPVALASMFSKYTRELFMTLFGEYWRARAFQVRPTAGYPQDATRFLAEIRPYLEKEEEGRMVRIR